ncbi:MAG: 30S ribosomal protein S2 [Planctomycetota bacterium]
MALVSIDELIAAGVHFGHKVSRWNPKMGRFIFGKRNLIHIIDLVETLRGLARAKGFLTRLAATGRAIVFVGTKRQIKGVVTGEAQRAGMPYVSERWLGGTLTNFTTIRSRLKRLEELEALEAEGRLGMLGKKDQSRLQRELNRIRKNLDGIRELDRMPGALVVVDPHKEYIAVREANKLGIPICAVLDTDCDPDDVDLPIPGNDDAMRSVQILLSSLVDSILEGKANYSAEAAAEVRIEDQSQIRTVRKRSGKPRPGRRGPPQPGGRPAGLVPAEEEGEEPVHEAAEVAASEESERLPEAASVSPGDAADSGLSGAEGLADDSSQPEAAQARATSGLPGSEAGAEGPAG